MPKRKGNFNAWRLETLTDPVNAANYLNAALEDSPELFLNAIKDTIQARSVSHIAQQARVTRESLYRSFSTAGNPTFETLGSVLKALGLKLSGVTPEVSTSAVPPSSGHSARTPKRRSKYGRRGVTATGQLTLPFDRNRDVVTLSMAKTGIIGFELANSTFSLFAEPAQFGSGARTGAPKLQQREQEVVPAFQEQMLSGAMPAYIAQDKPTLAAVR